MIQMNSRRLNTPVGALNLVFNDMRQRDFDQLRIPPMLIQDGAGHGAHAVADQSVLKTHAFQCHVAGLAIGDHRGIHF